MVRINLLKPEALSDQHLIAEYDEILMLLGYVKKNPIVKEMPETYRLGKGHMLFFKDKLLYIEKRHSLLKKEMGKRGFKATIEINLSDFPNNLKKDWSPDKEDFKIIKARIIEKLKKKPDYYRYCREKKPLSFFIGLIENSD